MQANDPKVVVYAQDVKDACPVCGEKKYIFESYDTNQPEAIWLGLYCLNCHTSFPARPSMFGVMDDDDEIPF